jgi:hypothetical protein
MGVAAKICTNTEIVPGSVVEAAEQAKWAACGRWRLNSRETSINRLWKGDPAGKTGSERAPEHANGVACWAGQLHVRILRGKIRRLQNRRLDRPPDEHAIDFFSRATKKPPDVGSGGFAKWA